MPFNLTVKEPRQAAGSRLSVHHSPSKGDVLLQVGSKTRQWLIQADGLGLMRRARFWALLGWLPLALWAACIDRALPGVFPEPMMENDGIHARLLIAVPLLIIA